MHSRLSRQFLKFAHTYLTVSCAQSKKLMEGFCIKHDLIQIGPIAC